MKIIAISAFILLATYMAVVSMDKALDSATYEQPKPTWKPVVVKKKYSENSVTKDLIFGTGNWHSTDYYIIDKNNKMWSNISKQDYILCDAGDTLWTNDGIYLQLNKNK